VNFTTLIDQTVNDTVASLGPFRPELAICVAIVALPLVSMLARNWKQSGFWVTVFGLAAAIYFAAPWRYLEPEALPAPQEIFTGMLVFDSFAVYMRGLLLFFTLLFVAMTQISGFPDRRDASEFYVLILGSVLGMCLMVAANHMLIVFVGFEMASVPAYVLAGMLRNRRTSSEAALKFAVFGAGAAGVMLYGISLLVGALDSAHLPTMAIQLAETLQSATGERTTILVLGGLMVMVGLAFKISAVPFHFWTPDVFEGATAEVAAFLSIASKAAALALLVRLAVSFGQVGPAIDLAHVEPTTRTVAASTDDTSGQFRFTAASSASVAQDALEPARRYMAGIVALLAAITCTFGNLAAYGQTNIKRLLAYSTIAHAGYMMMPIAAGLALVGEDPSAARDAIAALGFYLGIYLFMNLGAFALAAVLRNELGSEEIEDYAGLVRRSPGLVVCAAVVFFSLVGLPPLAGFAAKFTIFAALLDAKMFALLAIGAINTVLSLFYYLRVVKVMALEGEPENRPTATVPLWSAGGLYTLLVSLPLLVLGIWWDGLYVWAERAARLLIY
jgi:NADH-quinone oxidoreductase subunit N